MKKSLKGEVWCETLVLSKKKIIAHTGTDTTDATKEKQYAYKDNTKNCQINKKAGC